MKMHMTKYLWITSKKVAHFALIDFPLRALCYFIPFGKYFQLEFRY